MRRAVENCRRNRGPSFVHAKVIRPYSHSLSDDEKLYRADEERVADAERDPVKRFGARLIDEKVIDQDGLQQLKDEIDREINEAADTALASPQPAPDTVTLYVYSPDVDPTSSDFDTEENVELSGNPRHDGRSDQSLSAHRDEA
jgi:2-oxoisovalerate dehydrogenase E1 component